MSRKYFGTDGIRGRVGQPPITPDFVLKLAHAVGRVLKRSEDRPTVLIGKDTRISGYMLESALESGFNSAGVDVILLGPLPTAVAASRWEWGGLLLAHPPELAACAALYSLCQVVGFAASMHLVARLERRARLNFVSSRVAAQPELETAAVVAEWQLERMARPALTVALELALTAVLAWQVLAAALL